MTSNNENFNLVEMTKEGTQLRTIAVIFENNIFGVHDHMW